MADSFLVNLGERSAASLTISGYNNGPGDPGIYMQILANTSFSLLPGESLKVLIVPTEYFMTDMTASGMLNDSFQNDYNNGIVGGSILNDGLETANFDGQLMILDLHGNKFENSRFNLHWLQKLKGYPSIYGNNKTGIYSYPHNLQASEVSLVMEPIGNTKVRYRFSIPEVVNSGDALYTGAHQPYQLGFYFLERRLGSSDIASGVINGLDVEFTGMDPLTSGFAPPSNTGITLELPMYDPRAGLNEVPAAYSIYIGYKGAGGLNPTLLNITSRHFDFLNNKLPELDNKISTTLNSNKLQRVGLIKIDRKTIERKRLSIGIKDIVVQENSYEKQGTFISPRYTSENGIYTFSLRVKENIPDYPNVDKYSTVRYYVEFNGLTWEPISPVNRLVEYDSKGMVIPKLLIFDQDPGDFVEGIKYLNFVANITSFRLKITFDITAVPGLVIPPEVMDYKCVIFDKRQLLEL